MSSTVADAPVSSAAPPSPRALTVDELDQHGTPSHEVYTAGFYASEWDFIVRGLLGKASRGGADAGEVLATIAAVDEGDHPAWFAAWTALADRVGSIADDAAARGHRVSAARAHLRAANYRSVAVNSISGAAGTDALLPAFRAHRASWEGFVANTHWLSERVDIPYEDTTLPGWVFHPGPSFAPRRTLVLNNGSDGSLSGSWTACAEGALERGYRVLMFDGPGQQSMLYERNVPFRYDWEKVLTPVVDFLLARSDVDQDRLAVYGVSQAGYWVPRALAFEHRFAAAIADGGAVDVSRTWFDRFPASMLDLYHHGRTQEFDRLMAAGMARDGGTSDRIWQFRAYPYGVSGYSAVLDEVSRYRLGDLAAQITTPTYVIDPDGEQFFPGQPLELAQGRPNLHRVHFTQSDGASYHCQPMARELTEQRMFDWLDERLA